MSAPDRARGVRASDAERERFAQLLQSAAAEGRLSPEEAGERSAAASAATYREELYQLIADLPVDRDQHPRERVARPPLAAWWLWSALRLAFLAILVLGFWGATAPVALGLHGGGTSSAPLAPAAVAHGCVQGLEPRADVACRTRMKMQARVSTSEGDRAKAAAVTPVWRAAPRGRV